MSCTYVATKLGAACTIMVYNMWYRLHESIDRALHFCRGLITLVLRGQLLDPNKTLVMRSDGVGTSSPGFFFSAGEVLFPGMGFIQVGG